MSTTPILEEPTDVADDVHRHLCIEHRRLKDECPALYADRPVSELHFGSRFGAHHHRIKVQLEGERNHRIVEALLGDPGWVVRTCTDVGQRIELCEECDEPCMVLDRGLVEVWA